MKRRRLRQSVPVDEGQTGWTYTFRDALRGGPSPCPACNGETVHTPGCRIKELKRRYFMLLFGPLIVAFLVWDLLANGLGSVLDGVVPALIGCAIVGVWLGRRRKT